MHHQHKTNKNRYGDLRAVMMALESKRIKLNSREKLSMAVQLAAGCEHLAKRKLVHMDLAARNVLVGDNSLVKIADFGLTRPFDAGTTGVTLSEPIRLAIKWAAPESITQLKFSEASDCWSLGVTVWEIFAYGKMPWLGVTNVGVLQQIAKKKRMEKPKGCHNSAWAVLEQCWHILPARRPSFRAVRWGIDESFTLFFVNSRTLIGCTAPTPLQWGSAHPTSVRSVR